MIFTVGDDGETNDLYDYSPIEYLMKLLNMPYDNWDLEIHYKSISHSSFKEYAKNDYCPCGSLITYQECCLKNEGVKTTEYEFIIEKPPLLK